MPLAANAAGLDSSWTPEGHDLRRSAASRWRDDPFVYDGAMNGTVFLANVEQVLVPMMKPGDIVIMDNLPAHKLAGVRETIERTSATLSFLPPYSPDMNPIENALQSSWSCSGPRPSAGSVLYGTPAERSSTSSRRLNASATLKPQDIPD